MFSLFGFSSAFASETATAVANQPNPIASFLPLLLVIIVFYFFMIRPQQKKQREFNAMLANVKVSDKVSTVAGIIGEIAEIDNDKQTVTLTVAKGVQFLIYKKSIAEVLSK